MFHLLYQAGKDCAAQLIGVNLGAPRPASSGKFDMAMLTTALETESFTYVSAVVRNLVGFLM